MIKVSIPILSYFIFYSQFVKRVRSLPSPSFFLHGQEDLRKGIDTEGQVLEPLECSDH
jgi:hypothetical protein